MADNENSDGKALFHDLLGAAETFLSNLPSAVEFWSAIIGALVGAVAGGVIAYLIQIKALREGRKQRAEDHKQVQQALGNSVLFKMIRIYSDFHGIRKHFESSFEKGAKDGLEDAPWQFVLPIVNPPSHVHFSSEEMGMLLTLKDDDVFNLIISMDVIHNSLIDAIKGLSDARTALTDRLTAETAEGNVVTTTLNEHQVRALRPQMIAVNSLIQDLRTRANRDYVEGGAALERLHKLLRDKLGLINKLEFTNP